MQASRAPRIPLLALVMTLAMVVAGCGQKGPLYLPGSQADPARGSAPSGDSKSTAPTGSEPAPEIKPELEPEPEPEAR